MKDDRVYLLHIRDACERIVQYVAGGRDPFMADSKTQDAVIRNLEIIGEAVKNLSEPCRAGRPDVQWKRIAGMRDKVIHEYFGVNLELVCETVEREVPKLRSCVDQMLVPPDQA